MEEFMKDSTCKMQKLAKQLKFIQMELDMKDGLEMEKEKEKGFLDGLMEKSMMVSGEKDSRQEKECGEELKENNT